MTADSIDHPTERLIEVVIDAPRHERRQGLEAGTWVHELKHNSEGGFFIAHRYHLESGGKHEHFTMADELLQTVQGAWQRCANPKQPVEISTLQAFAEVFGGRS